ncbi:MAG: AmmeMemoRadiSam system radical SAM enzyme, partial [Hyphomicrobiales bacterium]
RQSSYCHVCGTRTIGREGYVISEWNLDDRGACTGCGTPMAGVFDGPAGTWGARRQPVDLTRFA